METRSLTPSGTFAWSMGFGCSEAFGSLAGPTCRAALQQCQHLVSHRLQLSALVACRSNAGIVRATMRL